MAVIRSSRLFAVNTGPAQRAFSASDAGPPEVPATGWPETWLPGPLATNDNIYQCPAGHRAILRSIDIVLLGTVLSHFTACSLWPPSEPLDFPFYWVNWTEGMSWSGWRGHLVMNAGDWIKVISTDIDVTWSGSGALLPIQ